MILPDHAIRRAVSDGSLGIFPFHPEQIQPASYDLLLDKHFRRYKMPYGLPIDPKSSTRWTEAKQWGTRMLLDSGDFCLASTVEKIRMPSHLVGRVEGKSSLARMGLFVHVTAGFIDPGFEGHITLELFNANRNPIWLYPEMPVAQIAFERLSSPAERPYGSGATGSKYANQPKGPVESMYFRNFDGG